MPWYWSITHRFHSKHGSVFHTLRSILGGFEIHMCEDISEQSRQLRNLIDTFGRVNLHSMGGPPQAPPPARGRQAPCGRRGPQRRRRWDVGAAGREHIPEEPQGKAGVDFAEPVAVAEPEAQPETPSDHMLSIYVRGSPTTGVMSFSPPSGGPYGGSG